MMTTYIQRWTKGRGDRRDAPQRLVQRIPRHPGPDIDEGVVPHLADVPEVGHVHAYAALPPDPHPPVIRVIVPSSIVVVPDCRKAGRRDLPDFALLLGIRCTALGRLGWQQELQMSLERRTCLF